MVRPSYRNAFFIGMSLLFQGWPRGFAEKQVELWDAGVRVAVPDSDATRSMILEWQNGVRPALLAYETPSWIAVAEAAAESAE